MWYLFANFVVHTKKHINVCFALYIFPVFVHRKSWARFMLFPSLLPRPSPSNFSYDFSSPAVPSLICISHIYLEQKHLLHIALLNGTDRMILDLLNGYCLWQAEGGENFHLLYHPLHSYSHSFCNCWLSWSQEAEGNSRRELSSQEFWSETTATAESWLTVDESVRQGQTSSFQALHWTMTYLNTWLTSLLLRDIYLWVSSRLKHYLTLQIFLIAYNFLCNFASNRKWFLCSKKQYQLGNTSLNCL